MTQSAKQTSTIEKKDKKQNVICFLTTGQCDRDIPTYWVKFDSSIVNKDSLEKNLARILVDTNFEDCLVAGNQERKTWAEKWKKDGYDFWAEKQFLPGVTDNLAKTIQEALKLMGESSSIEVASGKTYLLKKESEGSGSLEDIKKEAAYNWYHPLVENFQIYDLNEGEPEHLLSYPSVTLNAPAKPKEISLDLNDHKLEALSKERLLALNLAEMKAIKDYYKKSSTKKERTKSSLPENPTDVELEIIAQTWSEHCKHKIFNAKISYTEKSVSKEGKLSAPHHKTIDSLYKTYIKGATKKLSHLRTDLLSVFEDNSGIVKWNDDYGVCFKVETHNSPSALEPYGGALTGILGVNRDILGTGLGAKPLFNTDVFCFASPRSKHLDDRPKLLPPGTIPKGVRKGVEDGGNKSGIPTVNGSIYFHDGFRAKPLVFCGTGGILPLKLNGKDHVFKHTKPQDKILVVGGRVGKDGIHGATFSSESLNEGSPVTAVQIGDPFTQKRVIDYVLKAQELGLITGITDNGAGGLSSSVGEMATITNGATVDLAKVPLKYPGLEDWEIIISESQERMTISTQKLEEMLELAKDFDVEVSHIGEFNDSGYFKIERDGNLVGLIDLEFLHEGLPRLELEASWQRTKLKERKPKEIYSVEEKLITLLKDENISSREEVIRQYDHEVQGGSVIKPLMGKNQNAPSDAGVILPLLNEKHGLAVSNGVCPQWSKYDPYLMAQMAVDEAVRNGVCVGADPETFSLLDNFCWPDPVISKRNTEGDYKLGQLVRTCQGLYDACLAYNAPLISGKDSMKNDFDDGVVRLSIPPTLLVSAIARVNDVNQCISSEFKEASDIIYLVSAGSWSLTGSTYDTLFGETEEILPSIELTAAHTLYKGIHKAITNNLLHSAHDLSEGGLLVALAEKAIGSELGAKLNLDSLSKEFNTENINHLLFGEGPASILVTVPESKKADWLKLAEGFTQSKCTELGQVTREDSVNLDWKDKKLASVSVEKLTNAWMNKLPME